MKSDSKISLVTTGLTLLFLGLAAAFVSNLWGRVPAQQILPLVDTNFISTATVRMSAAELIASGEDASGLDCKACHEGKTLKLEFDEENNVILPKEHSDIILGHGKHKRNNNCFNCHDETDTEFLQTRDKHKVKLVDSPDLCGSCHGPTYRDWEAGVHGRTSGYWKRELGPFERKVCTSCHDPHRPAFPGREPAPGPHSLRPIAKATTEGSH